MKKSYKIKLACVCAVLVLLGIWKMTDTAPATDRNPEINAGHTESEDRDSRPKNKVDHTESEEDSKKIIIIQDGREWTINVDPSVLGDNFDWDNFDVGITGEHEKNTVR